MRILASVPRPVCPTCGGSGRIAVGPWGARPPKKECPQCAGVGRAPRAHQANPILFEFREAVRRGDPYADAESWATNLQDMTGDSDGWTHHPDDVDHALAVFERWVRVLGKLPLDPTPWVMDDHPMGWRAAHQYVEDEHYNLFAPRDGYSQNREDYPA